MIVNILIIWLNVQKNKLILQDQFDLDKYNHCDWFLPYIQRKWTGMFRVFGKWQVQIQKTQNMSNHVHADISMDMSTLHTPWQLKEHREFFQNVIY